MMSLIDWLIDVHGVKAHERANWWWNGAIQSIFVELPVWRYVKEMVRVGVLVKPINYLSIVMYSMATVAIGW